MALTREQVIKMLNEATQGGKFFITLSWVDPNAKPGSNDLKHWWGRYGFPAQDMLHSLGHLINDIRAKEPELRPVKEEEVKEWE